MTDIGKILQDLGEKFHKEGRFFVVQRGEIPGQGFKLHVSTRGQYSEHMLKRLVPLFQKMGVSYKVDKDVDRMTGTQRGKFITIYPKSDQDALRVAAEVDEGLAEASYRPEHGTKIPNDRPLPKSKSGLVYYRFGSFTQADDEYPKGYVIIDGKITPDRRGGDAVPPGVTDIFQTGKPRPTLDSVIKEQDKITMISTVKSPMELYRVIGRIGPIKGSGKTYKPDEIAPLIRDVMAGKISPDVITRTYGLREKVVELKQKYKR